MQLYISVSKKPGTTGTRVYNTLFKRYQLPACYVARVAPTRAEDLISSIKALNIAGCSVSMPLKTTVVSLLDELTPIAEQTNSVNSIKPVNGKLIGHNTDYFGLYEVLKLHKPSSLLLYGYGSVARSVVAASIAAGVSSIAVTGRDIEAARAFCNSFNGSINVELNPLIATQIDNHYDMLVNATPASVESSAESLLAVTRNVSIVFDLVIPPQHESILVEHARYLSIPTISGVEMYRHQVKRQFEFYTGIEPTDEEIIEALSN